jgi:hypothetical protein
MCVMSDDNVAIVFRPPSVAMDIRIYNSYTGATLFTFTLSNVDDTVQWIACESGNVGVWVLIQDATQMQTLTLFDSLLTAVRQFAPSVANPTRAIATDNNLMLFASPVWVSVDKMTGLALFSINSPTEMLGATLDQGSMNIIIGKLGNEADNSRLKAIDGAMGSTLRVGNTRPLFQCPLNVAFDDNGGCWVADAGHAGQRRLVHYPSTISSAFTSYDLQFASLSSGIFVTSLVIVQQKIIVAVVDRYD